MREDFKFDPMTENSPYRLSSRPSIVKDLVLVDGVMRSGKHMHAPIISSLERSEMWQNYPIFEDVPVLHGLGLLSDDVARALLQREADMDLFYTLIGRRVNFRYGDASGVWRFRDPRVYFERIFSRDERQVLNQLDTVKPIMVVFVHDCLCHAGILFNAFPTVRHLWTRRHPIDVIYSWHKKDWGRRIGIDPASTFLAIESPAGPVPWFATSWAEAYIALPPMDRIIRGVDALDRMATQGYLKLSAEQRRQVWIITFEWAVTEADSYLRCLTEFLGTHPTSATAATMANERVPRQFDKDDFDTRLETIRDLASAQAFELAVEMGRRYETESREIWGVDIAPHRRHMHRGPLS